VETYDLAEAAERSGLGTDAQAGPLTDVVPAGPHGPLAHVLTVRGGTEAGPKFGLHHREALIYTLG
jgi:hypothetical protein